MEGVLWLGGLLDVTVVIEDSDALVGRQLALSLGGIALLAARALARRVDDHVGVGKERARVVVVQTRDAAEEAVLETLALVDAAGVEDDAEGAVCQNM